jgi:hypothetical protein
VRAVYLGDKFSMAGMERERPARGGQG